MPAIHKAYANDFDLIYPLLLEFDNPLLNKQDWRALFAPHWDAPQDHFGYYIEEDGRAVGFLGTVFSRRTINGQPQNFCNMTTWVVKEEYRGMSLMLLFELLKLKGYTITNFTAYHVAGMLRKAGFKDLAAQVKVFPPLPNPAVLWSSLRVITAPEQITGRLQGDLMDLHCHHAPLKCQQTLLEKGSEQCLVIFDVVRRKRLPVARVHFISNPAFFARHAGQFLLSFCIKNRVTALIVPENLLKGHTSRWAFSIPQRQTQLYKSADLTANDIDALYSELQILGLKN